MKNILLFLFLLSSALYTNAQQKKYKLAPDHAKLQFAGAIGFISGGLGYELTPKKKLHADLYYGHVPKSAGGITIHSFTGKVTWFPLSKKYENGIHAHFLTTGAFLNYTLGRQYHLFSRTNYSFNYYGFPTAGALGFFAGGAINKNRIGAYYEIIVMDRDGFSFATNTKSIPFHEILILGVGVKYKLRAD